jgi:hypothetical protein
LKVGARKTGVALLVLTCLLSGGFGFGMGCDDIGRARAFTDAVRRWQTNPDFRAVQDEYVTLGAEAMSARLCGIPAERYIMSFRSLPGLPSYLAVSDSSEAHYRAFSRGPLSAYLHLAGEQGVGGGVAMVEDLGRRATLSDDDVRGFLRGFKLPVPVATDDGAVASVRRLVRDTMPTTQPFAIRESIVPAIRRHVGSDVDSIRRDEQERVMRTLDDDIRRADAELWRTKQVSDFLAGIWAQGYGQVYETAIDWLFVARRAARALFVVTVVLLAWGVYRKRASGDARDPTRRVNPAAKLGEATSSPTV